MASLASLLSMAVQYCTWAPEVGHAYGGQLRGGQIIINVTGRAPPPKSSENDGVEVGSVAVRCFVAAGSRARR